MQAIRGENGYGTVLIKRSTRRFFRESKALGRYGPAQWLHGYVYARWIYAYIAIAIGEHPLVRSAGPAAMLIYRTFTRITGIGRGDDTKASVGFADSYHGKVVTPEGARTLVTLDRPVTLTDLETVVPFARARDIIINNPDHIVVLACPCRSAREHPCLPLDVCLIVGEPFAGFVLEHHPHTARRIDPQEALEILAAENRRGHVAHAFFKDAMLDRFYAICNCCSCCCGAMQAQRNGTPMLAPSGYRCVLEPERCSSCGMCTRRCQFGAIEGARQTVDAARCMGCGVCVSSCPEKALSLVRDPARGEPLEIRELLAACSDRQKSAPLTSKPGKRKEGGCRTSGRTPS